MPYAGIPLRIPAAMDQPSEERRRRLRAARAYAGLSHADLGEKIGVSQFTVQRFEAGTGPDDPVREEVFLRRSAEACGLPYEFFTVDWSAFSFEQEAEQLGQEIRRFQALLDQLEEAAGAFAPAGQDPAELDRALDEQERRAPADEHQQGARRRT